MEDQFEKEMTNMPGMQRHSAWYVFPLYCRRQQHSAFNSSYFVSLRFLLFCLQRSSNVLRASFLFAGHLFSLQRVSRGHRKKW